MRKPRIAILGATGVVGREITKITEELNVEFESIRFLSSARSAGSKITFKGKEYTVEEAVPEIFDNIDIVMASAGGSTSQKFAPEIVKRGGVIIDNSSAFRMEKDVPLVIAGVNDEDLRKHKGIIANPNCSTSQLMLVLEPLKKFDITRLIVSTYQAVSGAGLAAINELRDDTIANLEGKSFENKCFKKPISFNVIPQIDVFCENGYTKEEMKLVYETQKILSDDSISITPTAVRVPVYRSHSESVYVETEETITPDEARALMEAEPGLIVQDDPHNNVYPMPLFTSDTDEVYVGRIRRDLGCDKALNLWIAFDQLRKGAATNAVQIAEELLRQDLI